MPEMMMMMIIIIGDYLGKMLRELIHLATMNQAPALP